MERGKEEDILWGKIERRCLQFSDFGLFSLLDNENQSLVKLMSGVQYREPLISWGKRFFPQILLPPFH